MYCPNCGNAEQVAETYCRKCGVFLYDPSKPDGITRPQEESARVPIIISAFRIAVCFTFAILLYAVPFSLVDSHSLINISAIILFAMGLVQLNALRRTISRRRRLEKRELATGNAGIAGKFLDPPNLADLMPESVTVPTTRKLAHIRK
jgi:hypothetical protein